jgi:hypothetical protein
MEGPRTSGVIGASIAAAIIGCLAPPASAQISRDGCREGRFAESGYCCWPGQHPDEHGACRGTPTCPEGRVVTVDDCVVPVPPVIPVPSTETEMDTGLFGAGLALLLVGYLGPAITDTVGGHVRVPSPGPCTTFCLEWPGVVQWPIAWVPFASLIAVYGSGGAWTATTLIVGGIGTALQVAGLIMTIVGQMGHSRSTHRASRERVRFQFGASSAEASFELWF